MRLLKTHTTPDDLLETVEFVGSDQPPYAILSHSWESDEVLYADLKDVEATKTKKGYEKIRMTLAQAHKDGLEYAWIDTCCINKESSAELSEAINSMFEWYSNADICYVFLSDFTKEEDHAMSTVSKCRWFTRGWTLQELLAPTSVRFFDKDWVLLGSKISLVAELREATGIDDEFLLERRALGTASVAKRMSWASRRVTTRVEDIAYSLLGIFDVNMPMLYGEGSKAFIRLQEQILASSDDQSLFAWKDSTYKPGDHCGLLASSPAAFAESGDMIPYAAPQSPERRDTHTVTNKGLYVELNTLSFSETAAALHGDGEPVLFGMLECMSEHENSYVIVQLRPTGESANHFARSRADSLLRSLGPMTIRRGIYVRQRETGLRRARTPFHYIQYTGWTKGDDDDEEFEAMLSGKGRAAQSNSAGLGVSYSSKATYTDIIGNQGSWVQPKDEPKIIAIPKGARLLSAYITISPTPFGGDFVLLIGSDESWRLAFDATPLITTDMMKRTTEMQTKDKELPFQLRQKFDPKPPGTVLALSDLDIIVDVTQEHGVQHAHSNAERTCSFALRLSRKQKKPRRALSKLFQGLASQREWDAITA